MRLPLSTPGSLAFLATLLLGTPALARAQACPEGDLLAGRRPSAAHDVVGDPARVSDQRLAPEAAPWDSYPAVRLEGTAASVTWDLGGPREVRALVLQADANDRYPFAGSLDGIAFAPLGDFAALPDADGLRRRTLILAAPVALRYLRLDPPDGDGYASVAELEAFCRLPRVWPPPLPVEPVALAAGEGTSRWNDLASRRWELALALLGLVLLATDRRRERRDGAPKPKGWRVRLFAAAGLVATLTYFNFGTFHFGGYVHNWDTLHYYLGAKYFRELSYERLYDCMAVADAEEPRLLWRVQHRPVTDLRTNVLGSTREILAHPERCTAHFSPARWQAFRADLAWFRQREAPRRWEEISSDHGFNGTPVWLIAGSALANTGTAGEAQILGLTLLDPLYYLALIAVLGWAFGLRPLAVALLVFATFFPCRFFWTGGSFLRWDWLFYGAAALACLKKGRPWLGGMALGYAALLRIFPALLAAGPAAALIAFAGREIVSAWRRPAEGTGSAEPSAAESGGGLPLGQAVRAGLRAALRRPEVHTHLRFLGGAALAALVLVPVSLAATGGPETYRAFVANTRKHQATPLTNHMGLRTVAAYRPSEVGRRLYSTEAGGDPWQRWKEARLAAWHRARPFAALLALGALTLLGRAALRRPEPWIAAALGVLWIAFAVELTSYYYAFVLLPALLWAERRSVGIALLALSACSQLVSFGPWLGLPAWRDEQYTLISLACLLVFGGILIAMGRPVNEGTGPASAGPVPREGRRKPRPTGRRS